MFKDDRVRPVEPDEAADVVLPPPLGPLTFQVYGWVLDHGRVDRPGMVADLGIGLDELHSAIETLAEWQLLREMPEGTAVVAARPDAALAETMHPLETLVSRFQLEIGRVREEFDALMAVYLTARDDDATTTQVGENDAAMALRALVTGCRHELLVASPGKQPLPVVLREALWGPSSPLSAAVTVRGLYQHSSRFDPTARDHVEAARRAGATIRTVSELPDQMVVFDREVALLPGGPGRDGLVVRERSVVDFLVRVFEKSWAGGSSFTGEAGWHRDLVDTVQQDIVRLLMDGFRDEAVAQRLDISLRTCRRHIAKIMERLGAESRFQAGYLLREQDRTG
jgi:DNA-binding CsgD family transcriptional regulator